MRPPARPEGAPAPSGAQRLPGTGVGGAHWAFVLVGISLAIAGWRRRLA
jgi:hypothetical protein